jgi:hypothetical protein
MKDFGKRHRQLIEDIDEVAKEVNDPNVLEYGFESKILNRIFELLRGGFSGEDYKVHLYSKQCVYIDEYNALARTLTCKNGKEMVWMKFYLQCEEVQEIAELTGWLVLYDMIRNSEIPVDLRVLRGELWDMVATKFTNFSESRIDECETPHRDLVITLAQSVSGALLCLLIKSFRKSGLTRNWLLVAQLESIVSKFLLGFSAPELSTLHKDVFWALPGFVRQKVPRDLGYVCPNPGGRVGLSSKDFVLAFSRQKKNATVLRERGEYLLTTGTRTELVERGITLRGVPSLPHSRDNARVPQSRIVSCDVMNIRANMALSLGKRMLMENRRSVNDTVQSIYRDQRLCRNMIFRKSARLNLQARPLAFSFEMFQNVPTAELPLVVRVKKEVLDVKQRREIGKRIVRKIRELDSEMWRTGEDCGSWVNQEDKSRNIMHEYFGPSV